MKVVFLQNDCSQSFCSQTLHVSSLKMLIWKVTKAVMNVVDVGTDIKKNLKYKYLKKYSAWLNAGGVYFTFVFIF